ncbi:MAG: glycosyltransferase family 39 protein, partial [Nitrososphaerales archaeon]
KTLLIVALLLLFFALSLNTPTFKAGLFNVITAEALRNEFETYPPPNDYFYNPSPWTSVTVTISNSSKPSLSDANLYALAGWEYIHGASPHILNPEHPPLAKYLIGLSEIIFTNQFTMSFIFGMLTIIVVYLISREILGASLFAFLPPFMLVFDKLFSEHSLISTLDIYVTFFVALSTLFFLKGLKKPKLFLLASITFGLAMATKWLAIFLFPAFLFVLISKRKWVDLKWFLASLPLAILAYTSTYAIFFINGNNFNDFIELQRAMLNYQLFLRQNSWTPPLRILQILTTGISGQSIIYHMNINLTTSEVTVTSTEYGIAMITEFNPLTWSISFAAAILAFYYAYKKRDHLALTIPVLLLTFIAIFSTAQVFEWYLLPILFSGFISITYLFKNFYDNVNRKRFFKYFMISYIIAIFIFFMFISIPYHITL